MLTVPAEVGCEAHKAHAPAPTYLELHHVIPQGWQKFWQPPNPHFIGDLWDPRTVALCRTGHGNTHWWLVKMMKRYEELGGGELPTAATLINGDKFVRKDAAFAHLGMERWVEAGGDLMALCATKRYGYI